MNAESQIALDALLASIRHADAETTGPKYARLADAFTDCILQGRFKPGQRVPTETDLARDLPVSVGTVQKALTQLAADGLIVRHRKTGTYIADRQSQANEVFVYRFKDPATGETLLPFVRTLAVTTENADGPWAAGRAAQQFVRIDRLVWFDQEPPAFYSIYFTYDHGKAYLKTPVEDLNGASFHRMLIDEFNLPTLRMTHSMSCRALPINVLEHLRLPETSVGIIWDITDYSWKDEPVLFQRYYLPPGHRAIEIEEKCSR